MHPPYFPINDYDPIMKGMVIGGLGIFHVFVAQFAIGGGILMCYFQWLASSGKCAVARRFLESYFKIIVLISFVIGALTGVGMWFTAIQVSPRTIGQMVHEFHWLWAVEWTFFCLEVTAGYVYYRYGHRFSDRTNLRLLVLYTAAAWFSLFWINGILSWQLTPNGAGGEQLWTAFFNPSFFPSLFYRTIVSMTIAALAACIIINTMGELERKQRAELIHRAAMLLAPMAFMPALGIWFLAVIPEESRAWALGGSVAMTMFLTIAVGASLLIGGYAFIGLIRQKLYINGATATLLCALAFGATAGGEFVREGIRKPYTVRKQLYANSITTGEVQWLRKNGSVTHDPFPVRDAGQYPNQQLVLGAKVFRFQCSVCHTMSGANGLLHLAGTWTTEQRRLNIARLQHTKPFMPPFAGTAHELEALVQLIEWQAADRPERWPESLDEETLKILNRWLSTDNGGVPPEERAGEDVDPIAGRNELGNPPDAAQPAGNESPVKVSASRAGVSPKPLASLLAFLTSLPGPTATYMALYLVTLMVHWIFVAYVAIGVLYLVISSLVRSGDAHDPVAKILRDWLPFYLSAGITVGVAPLLFMQILYRQAFYSANLLLSHRWMAVLPVLIVGFYLLYVIKKRDAVQLTIVDRAARIIALACFAFAGYSWTENHLLSINPGIWPEFYGAGGFFYARFEALPRLIILGATAISVCAAIVLLQLRFSRIDPRSLAATVRRLAMFCVPALVIAWLAGIWYAKGLEGIGPSSGLDKLVGPYWMVALIGYLLLTFLWLIPAIRGAASRSALTALAVLTPLTLLAVTIIRESIRISRVDFEGLYEYHAQAARVGGMAAFIIFLAVNTMLITWCINTARSSAGPAQKLHPQMNADERR
ncbi:MAG: c-type cytochrome [Planctomycetota bacterium]